MSTNARQDGGRKHTAGAYDVRMLGSYCTTYPTWPT